MRFVRVCAAAIAACVSVIALPNQASSQDITHAVRKGPSGHPLPRFVSLKSNKVNLRIGPGRQYPVDWMYLKSGLPVEIIQEYDNWRRVRDAEGTEGWVYQSLLTGQRTAIAAPWHKDQQGSLISLMEDPNIAADTVAKVEPGAVGKVRECSGQWCRMDFSGHEGWMRQSLIWGVYPEETVKD